MNLFLLHIDEHILKELSNIFIIFFLLANWEVVAKFIVIVIFMTTHLIEKNVMIFASEVLLITIKQITMVFIDGDEC